MYSNNFKNRKMKLFAALGAVLITVITSGCGKPGVNLDNAPYNPKITVEGFVYPGQPVSGIKLMRNFPLNNTVNINGLYLTPSGNNVIATINGTPLVFDPKSRTYFSTQIQVDNGKSYKLEIFTTIDGTQLHTTSTTITPQKGFKVLTKNLGNFSYADSIGIKYISSPGTGFYTFSVVPDSASPANFIYNNGIRKKLTPKDVSDNLNQYKFRYDNVNNIDSYSNTAYSHYITIRNTWFYSSYTVIVYACDENFKEFLLTSPNVEEVDGNFHEPVETFQGDGIGVFGSAISDTVRFSIVK